MNNNPVWFKPTRGANTPADKPWFIMYRDLSNISGARRARISYDTPFYFASRAEAVAAGVAKGWVVVKTWKDAEQLAKPYLQARFEDHEARSAAREGLVKVKVGIGAVRWVTPERAAEILAFIGEPDEYGVIGSTKSEV